MNDSPTLSYWFVSSSKRAIHREPGPLMKTSYHRDGWAAVIPEIMQSPKPDLWLFIKILWRDDLVCLLLYQIQFLGTGQSEKPFICLPWVMNTTTAFSIFIIKMVSNWWIHHPVTNDCITYLGVCQNETLSSLWLGPCVTLRGNSTLSHSSMNRKMESKRRECKHRIGECISKQCETSVLIRSETTRDSRLVCVCFK